MTEDRKAETGRAMTPAERSFAKAFDDFIDALRAWAAAAAAATPDEKKD